MLVLVHLVNSSNTLFLTEFEANTVFTGLLSDILATCQVQHMFGLYSPSGYWFRRRMGELMVHTSPLHNDLLQTTQDGSKRPSLEDFKC